MVTNAVVLLEGVLAKARPQAAGQLAGSDFDTFWVADQYLKSSGVSPDEILAGLVDGQNDCGLDAVYVFANGICISDDTPLAALGRNPRLELVLMQTKDSKGFGEEAIDKMIVNLPELLSFSREEDRLKTFANPRVIETTRRFLNAYKGLDLPELQVYLVFASMKATHLHANTKAKGARLQKLCAELLGVCPVHVAFLGAQELYDMARESRIVTRSLQLAENPISTDTAGGYIGVVRLSDYQRFITADNGELDTALFEANVRDYEGETAVNRSIEQTLAIADEDVDFWWLNNGVTIVASKVQPANKLLQLEAPQIVNGLQTSTEIYKRTRAAGADIDNRSVLVKIIQVSEHSVRERIIRATNSQTSFGPSALRATDKVQRQIEDYLQRYDIYYERRRRHYFNQGVSMEKIISIDTMGQAITSIAVQLPHVARATPSRVFDSEIYEQAFHVEHPMQMFAAAIQLLRQCDRFLKNVKAESPENFRFQLAMLAAIYAARTLKPGTKHLADLENVDLEVATLQLAYEQIQSAYRKESLKRRVYLLDALAKNEEVTRALLEAAGSELRRRGSRR
jgi:hypothetical protein